MIEKIDFCGAAVGEIQKGRQDASRPEKGRTCQKGPCNSWGGLFPLEHKTFPHIAKRSEGGGERASRKKKRDPGERLNSKVKTSKNELILNFFWGVNATIKEDSKTKKNRGGRRGEMTKKCILVVRHHSEKDQFFFSRAGKKPGQSRGYLAT